MKKDCTIGKTIESKSISIYHILAAISANHCIATEYEKTNWKEILGLYDSLISIEDSPLMRLNRSVALSKVKGNLIAINELNQLKETTNIEDFYLFHSTIAEFYIEEFDFDRASMHLTKAISKAKNQRDIKLFKKKLSKIVPV